jgi:hypothetical protein
LYNRGTIPSILGHRRIFPKSYAKTCCVETAAPICLVSVQGVQGRGDRQEQRRRLAGKAPEAILNPPPPFSGLLHAAEESHQGVAVTARSHPWPQAGNGGRYVRRNRRAANGTRLLWIAIDSFVVKSIGEPDAGNRHVRFDERGRETGCWPISRWPESFG